MEETTEKSGLDHFVPGWYLTVFIIFQLFALYLYRFSNPPDESLDAMQPKTYWYIAIAAYATVSIEMLLRPLVDPNVKVTDPGGQAWLTGDIYQSMALVTIYTMILLSVLSTIRTALDEQTCLRVLTWQTTVLARWRT